MSTQDRAATSKDLHPATNVGHVALSVANLRRSIDFYTENIGLRVIDRGESTATLGAGDETLLILHEQQAAEQWPRGGRSYPGLYHFAILVPSRTDLGRWLMHWLQRELPQPGQADHFVSEAFYLEDPDGHGIEIYRDRPREEWNWQEGQVIMGAEPIDIRSLLEEAQRSADPWTNMPVGTTLGHIHLQVTNIDDTARFYNEVLGFDIAARMPSALFMSAGGYHHHIGANIWHSRDAEPAPADSVNLRYFTIEFPDGESRSQVTERLTAAGITFDETPEGIEVTDPSGIRIRLVTGERDG